MSPRIRKAIPGAVFGMQPHTIQLRFDSTLLTSLGEDCSVQNRAL